jgi:hypothetical protein
MDSLNQSLNRKIQIAVGALVFVVSFAVYFSTMQPTTSFWDCGEYIACSKILGVMHPPGNPLLLLFGRIMTMIPSFKDIGMRLNIFSVLTSALTIVFTFLIIIKLIKRWRGEAKNWEDRLILYASGAFGALAFAFTDSFWFNAVEAEVFGFSMFFTSAVIYLALLWEEQSAQASSLVLIILIFYLFGLANGVHLENILAFPFVLLIAFFHENQTVRRLLILIAIQVAVPAILYFVFYQFNPETMAYEALMQHQAEAGKFLLIFGLIWLTATLIYMYFKDRHVFAVWWILPAIGVLSYSLYLVIYIRAGLHPPINENDPSTLQGMKEYLGRNQYGTENMVLTFLYRKADFWNYQVQKMYNRYFAWNFIGKGTTMDSQDRIVEIFSFRGLYGLPFLVGLWGSIYHFMKDWKRALAVFILFFITGYGILLYVNQPDPQPRERDYSYVGSFFAFALWIGIGMAALFEWIADAFKKNETVKKIVFAAAGILLTLAVPINLFAFNHRDHSRAGNYVAYDYSYNILATCEPDAIIFTNGDNDTFPLWFLQEVEGIRKDVRIVNLSLLNTPWYIKQLRDEEPRVPINMSDQAIESLAPTAWKTQQIEIPVPPDVVQKARAELPDSLKSRVQDKMLFTVKPTFNAGAEGIRVQDYMVMRILWDNRWKKPVYYAVTVSSDNMIGLTPYFRMDGLAFKILPYKAGNEISGQILEDNLLKKYKYRNLNNPKVYNDINILKLLQNYRSAFMQLAQYFEDSGRNTDAIRVLDEMNKIMPQEVIPYSDERAALYINNLYLRAGKSINLTEQLRNVIPGQPQSQQDMLMTAGYYAHNLQDWDSAERILRQLIQHDHNDAQAYSELLRVFSLSRQHEKAAGLLEDYLLYHPEDTSASNELKRIQAAIASAPKPAAQKPDLTTPEAGK